MKLTLGCVVTRTGRSVVKVCIAAVVALLTAALASPAGAARPLVSGAVAGAPGECLSDVPAPRNGRLVLEEPFLIRNAARRAHIYTARPDGTDLRVLWRTPTTLAKSKTATVTVATVSPDARWMVYHWLAAPHPYGVIDVRTGKSHTLPIDDDENVDLWISWYSSDLLVLAHKPVGEAFVQEPPQVEYMYLDGSRAAQPSDAFAAALGAHPWEWFHTFPEVSPNHACLIGALRIPPSTPPPWISTIRIAPLDGSPPTDVRFPASLLGARERCCSYAFLRDHVAVTTGTPEGHPNYPKERLWTMDYDGGNARLFTEIKYDAFLPPVFSPDSKSVIYGSPSDTHPRYITRRLPNGTPHPLKGKVGEQRPYRVIAGWLPR